MKNRILFALIGVGSIALTASAQLLPDFTTPPPSQSQQFQGVAQNLKVDHDTNSTLVRASSNPNADCRPLRDAMDGLASDYRDQEKLRAYFLGHGRSPAIGGLGFVIVGGGEQPKPVDPIVFHTPFPANFPK
jgi:hypothetical protein